MEIHKKMKFPNDGCYDGKVAVAFIITSKGKIIGRRIIRDAHGGKLGNQILAIIDNAKWIPGSLDGKKVDVIYTFPIIFDFQ